MRLTRDGIKDCTAWEQAGIALPGYDVEAVSEKAKQKKHRYGFISVREIFSVSLLADLLTV